MGAAVGGGMYRTLWGIVAVFAAALAAVHLTLSASGEAPADFRFINGTEPQTLDPSRMTGQPEGRIADAIFEGLTRRDAATLRPVPGVAQSWTISPDGRTYVFRLREDAVWTDGRPVTAGDFVYAWRRLLDPAAGSEYAYILHPVRFAKAFHTYADRADRLRGPIAGALEALLRDHPEGVDAARWQRFLAAQRVHAALEDARDPVLRDALARRGGRLEAARLARFAEALGREARRLRRRADEADARFGVDAGVFARDERTLVVELEAPTAYFLEITAFYPAFPVPRWAVERGEDDWFLPGKIVSNGPFELVSWRVNERIRLVRSDTYWGRDAVHLGSVDALAVENETTALNLYLTGQVDWLPSTYPPDLVDQLRERPDFYSGPAMSVYYYRFNCERPPFDDRRVRQAIGLAIDRRLIVEEVLGLGQLPATHLVPPRMPGYDPPESRLGLDRERARALLAEAGYPGGAGFPEVGILYNTNEAHKKIAEVIADQLRRHLGIEVRAYNQEWQSYLATVLAGDYDMARAGWIGDYQDPNTFLDLWVTNGGNNNTGWGSPDYDRLIRAASDIASALADPEALLSRLKEPERARRRIEAVVRAPDAAARSRAVAALRMHLLREAEAILVQDAFPVVPIYFYVASGLVQPHVRGFYSRLVLEDGSTAANLQDLHPLRSIRVERDAPPPAAGAAS
jgi:oligopeptide transport system substrate-binding protein